MASLPHFLPRPSAGHVPVAQAVGVGESQFMGGWLQQQLRRIVVVSVEVEVCPIVACYVRSLLKLVCSPCEAPSAHACPVASKPVVDFAKHAAKQL